MRMNEHGRQAHAIQHSKRRTSTYISPSHSLGDEDDKHNDRHSNDQSKEVYEDKWQEAIPFL